MSSNVGVGHWLGHALHDGGHRGGQGGDWGSVGGGVGAETVVTVEVVVVIVAEGVSVWVVASSGVRGVVVSVAVVQVEGISVSLRLGLPLGDPGGGHVAEGGGGSAGQESGLGSAALRSDAVSGGQTDQRAGHGSNGLDNGSSGGCGEGSEGSKWQRSNCSERSNGSSDGGSDWERSNWSNWSWSSDERSSDWDSLTNRVDKTILVDVLRESLERDGSESSLSGDQISKGSSQ